MKPFRSMTIGLILTMGLGVLPIFGQRGVTTSLIRSEIREMAISTNPPLYRVNIFFNDRAKPLIFCDFKEMESALLVVDLVNKGVINAVSYYTEGPQINKISSFHSRPASTP